MQRVSHHSRTVKVLYDLNSSSALHTWSSPSSTSSRGGSIRDCNCNDDGEHAKHAKEEHVDGLGG